MLDLNHASGFVYGTDSRGDVQGESTARINAFIDAALITRHGQQQPRDYLGGSRIGEPCARRLVYEITHTPKDPAHEFDGRLLRIFDAGHQLEALSIQWLRAAGFDLRDRDLDGNSLASVSREAGCVATLTALSLVDPKSAFVGRLFSSTRPLARNPGMISLDLACDNRSPSTSRRSSSTWPTSHSMWRC